MCDGALACIVAVMSAASQAPLPILNAENRQSLPIPCDPVTHTLAKRHPCEDQEWLAATEEWEREGQGASGNRTSENDLLAVCRTPSASIPGYVLARNCRKRRDYNQKCRVRRQLKWHIRLQRSPVMRISRGADGCTPCRFCVVLLNCRMRRNSRWWLNWAAAYINVRQHLMRDLFHWFIIAALILLGLWGLSIAGEIYRAYLGVFLLIWLFIPIVSLWLRTHRIIASSTATQIRRVRNALIGGAVFLSFSAFAHFGLIRDVIGERFVAGYHVNYYEDSDEYGRPFRASDTVTDHWYSKVGLWVFEWAFLAGCVGIPYLTWKQAELAIKETKRRQAEDATAN